MQPTKSIWMKLVEIWGAERWQSILGDLSHTLALERLGPWMTERIFWRATTTERVVAFSFDDGPNADYTPQLLDILASHEIKATFFLVGRYVRGQSQIAQRLARGGHEIGNHTFSHRMLPFLSDDIIRREISQTHEVIREVTGVLPKFLRPPMGLFTRRTVDLAQDLGYHTVVGDVYPRDPNLPGKERIISRVLGRVRPGSLIILHDGGNTKRVDRSQTLEGVKAIIPRLRAAGFRFLTLSELVAFDQRKVRRKENTRHGADVTLQS